MYSVYMNNLICVRYEPGYPLVRLHSIELQKTSVFNHYIDAGFTYIRRINPPLDMVLREPSVGCIVELSDHV